MPDAPMGSVVFLAAYTQAAGVEPVRPIIKGSLAVAVSKYIASSHFTTMAPLTQGVRRRALERIRETAGSEKALTPDVIRADLKNYHGHAQHTQLKMWRGFCKYLMHIDALKVDPSKDMVRAPVVKSDGHIPWDHNDVEMFRNHHALNTHPRMAFELLYWTGASMVDAVRLGPGSIRPGGWLSYRRSKTGTLVEIPFDRELPHFAQSFKRDLDLLHKAIAAQADKHMTYIVTGGFANSGNAKSRAVKGASSWFSRQASAAGVQGKTAHGLRKSRDMEIAANNGSATAIMSWLGHSTLVEASRYIKMFDKRRALSISNSEQTGVGSSNSN
jgi:integrase